MTIMLMGTMLAILTTMGIMVWCARRGPTVFDRILAVNMFGTVTVLLIAVHGFLFGRPEFLDIALVYALINFLGTIAVVKFVTYSHLGHPPSIDDLGDL